MLPQPLAVQQIKDLEAKYAGGGAVDVTELYALDLAEVVEPSDRIRMLQGLWFVLLYRYLNRQHYTQAKKKHVVTHTLLAANGYIGVASLLVETGLYHLAWDSRVVALRWQIQHEAADLRSIDENQGTMSTADVLVSWLAGVPPGVLSRQAKGVHLQRLITLTENVSFSLSHALLPTICTIPIFSPL